MKRILSIFAVVALLASLFCVNVSAAVPTTTDGEWTLFASDDFDEDPMYFKNKTGDPKVGFVAAEEGSTNRVVDLQLGTEAGELTIKDKGALTSYYNFAAVGAGTGYTNGMFDSKRKLPDKIMIEFDMKGIDITGGLSVDVRDASKNANYYAVRINPNHIEENKWYTFRIYVDRTNGMNFDISNTVVYKKLRDSNDEFVKLDGEMTTAYNNTTTLDYGIGSAQGNYTVSFSINAHNSWIRPAYGYPTLSRTTTYWGTVDGKTANENLVYECLSTHYQIDNINIYSKSDYEYQQGIIAEWDMENANTVPVKTGSLRIEDTNEDGVVNTSDKYVQYVVNTVQTEENGNQYVKFTPSVAPFAEKTDYLVKYPLTDVKLPETFVLSFDANNAELGTGLDLVIGGDGIENTNNSYPRNTLYLRSHEGIKNTWYSYKVICTGTPKVNGNFTFTVYRKLRGSDDAWTKLDGASFAGKVVASTGTKDYGWASTMSSDKSWMNTLQIGANRRGLLDAYTKVDADSSANPADKDESKKNHEEAVWYIDNVMITEANAVTADFTVAENVLSADVNLSTAAATSAPVLAVYDGGRLVDVDFDALSHTGSAALAVDYDTTTLTAPTVQFLVWEALDKAPLIEPVDVAKYIAE